MTVSISAGAYPPERSDGTADRRVLVVDDDDSIRETLAEYLDLEGYEVLTAIDATSALALLASDHPSLLITDLSMPDSDGISLIETARKQNPSLPAILLTGFAEEGSGGAGSGSYHVLRKPVQMAQLLRVMTLLLNPLG
jgi:DNA-binding response OmpR family regulator